MISARAATLAATFERARGRKVFGYDSDTGRGAELTRDGRALFAGAGVAESRKAFESIDRVCVEGETGRPWQELQRGK